MLFFSKRGFRREGWGGGQNVEHNEHVLELKNNAIGSDGIMTHNKCRNRRLQKKIISIFSKSYTYNIMS